MDILRTKTYVLIWPWEEILQDIYSTSFSINKPYVVCNASSNLLPAYGTDFSADSRYIVIEVRMAV